MHSKIFQICLKPMTVDDFVHPDWYYDSFQDFADYIGEELSDKERKEYVEYLAEVLSELFDYAGECTLIYKGIGSFLTDWSDAIKQEASNISEDNILNDSLFRIAMLTEKTHKYIDCRFFVEGWNPCAGPFSDLIKFLVRQKEGTKLYIGSVIDFHF